MPVHQVQTLLLFNQMQQRSEGTLVVAVAVHSLASVRPPPVHTAVLGLPVCNAVEQLYIRTEKLFRQRQHAQVWVALGPLQI
jgi:hypothetical protein